uniref:Uncharacterized protein n=1 Tax=Denticeps clupeoides TaxID=299321 RepID=A0AAY4AVV0_9TELE
MAEAQMQKLGVYPHMEEEHEDCSGQGEVQERDLIQSSGKHTHTHTHTHTSPVLTSTFTNS